MNEKICPQCHFHSMKTWEELTGEQKFLAERLPLSAEYTLSQRKKHLFCPRCWNEIVVGKIII